MQKGLPPMTEYHLSRRELFKRVCPAVMGAAGLHISGPLVAAPLNAFPPVQRITGGPHPHWFGYYDKLYHVKSSRRIDLGSFYLPKIYTGEWRVDTHPRFSPDGRYVCIDAPYQNEGRQLLLIDIRGIVK